MNKYNILKTLKGKTQELNPAVSTYLERNQMSFALHSINERQI